MFVLTRQEQRAIAFVVLALALGLFTKHYRAQHAETITRPNELVQASPARAATPMSARKSPRPPLPGGTSSGSPKF
jgi:hypothetical protein